MPLTPGTTLGPYEIQAPLGAGGMGEVYKALDTRLDRTVAIKVLPERVAADPDLKQRFEREAKTISSLNHPHICTLHDIGEQDGVDFLVMEYLEGETLAQRLEKGALPLEQALTIGTEIADALDKAHRQGITHRDLKPGNIMLTKTGAKLLDFGLAKLRPAGTLGAEGVTAVATASEPLTGKGTLLGTPQYMAPEQLEGKEADHRTDIFAFGAIAYEMVTGKRAFEGESQASLIAAILEHEPAPMTELQTLAPARLDEIVTTCLAKGPEDRWQSIRDVGRQVKGSIERVPWSKATTPGGVRRSAMWKLVLPWAVGAMLAIATGIAVWSVMRPAPSRLVRFVVSPDATDPVYVAAGSPSIAISRGGDYMAFLTGTIGAGGTQLHVRALDRFESEPLVVEGALSFPFFSQDGQSLGYVEGGSSTESPPALKRVALTEGTVSTICNLPADLRGASWGPNDDIVFGTVDRASGLWRVSAVGGAPEQLTTPDAEQGEAAHSWPEILPDGQSVLFEIRGDQAEDSQISVLSLDTGEQKTVLRGGSFPRYSPSGHLLYGSQGTLWAVAFDVNRLETVGDPAPVQEGVLTRDIGGGADFSVSENGSLIYLADQELPRFLRTLVWVDDEGEEDPLDVMTRTYWTPRVSPDGARVAVGEGGDIWLHDLVSRRQTSRLTFEGAGGPVWAPGGDRLAFRSSSRGGGVFTKLTAGAGRMEAVASDSDGARLQPYSWTPDGEGLVLEVGPASAADIAVVTVGGNGAPQPLLGEAYSERAPALSPNGEWMAYSSDQTGRMEVYVVPFPDVIGAKWQVSTNGGHFPAWSPDGKELYYQTNSRDATLMGVPAEMVPTFSYGPAEVRVATEYFTCFP